MEQVPRLLQSNIGLAKKFVWVFHNILQKNPNELFGQPDRRDKTHVQRAVIQNRKL